MAAAARYLDIIAMPAEVVDSVKALAGHWRWIGEIRRDYRLAFEPTLRQCSGAAAA